MRFRLEARPGELRAKRAGFAKALGGLCAAEGLSAPELLKAIAEANGLHVDRAQAKCGAPEARVAVFRHVNASLLAWYSKTLLPAMLEALAAAIGPPRAKLRKATDANDGSPAILFPPLAPEQGSFLTAEQHDAVLAVVNRFHDAVAEAVASSAALPAEVLQALEQHGIPRWNQPAIVDQASAMGFVSAMLPDPLSAGDVTHEQWLQRLKHRRTIPLSMEEAHAVAQARESAGVYCRGLGNTVEEDTGRILIEANQEYRQAYEKVIRQEVSEAILWREQVDRIRTRIGRATGDWARDLGRIAVTEQNNAMQMGRAATIAGQYGDEAMIAKVPEPTACEACRAFYLDESGKPRIYKLSDIRHNTNARDPARPGHGRRRADYVPTVEGLHPRCMCDTVRVTPGWRFNDEWDLVPDEEEVETDG